MLPTLFFFLLTTFPDFSYSKEAALILARGGSKGLPLKNLQKVDGVTLLSRAIFSAKHVFKDVVVSTDHPLIALETIKNGAIIFRRSSVTATDWAPSIWGAAEFVANRPDIDILVLIQASSPFIKPSHLRSAIRKMKRPIPFDCVFSVKRSFDLRWREYHRKLLPENFELQARPRRQDWSGELIETGAFYISRRPLIENGIFQNDNCTIVEVSPAESLEVDSIDDLRFANALLSLNLA